MFSAEPSNILGQPKRVRKVFCVTAWVKCSPLNGRQIQL